MIDLWPAGRGRGVSTLRYRLAQKIKEITKYNTKGLQTRMFVAHRKLLHRTAEKTSIAENEYYIKPVSTRALSKSCCYALGAHSLTHTHTHTPPPLALQRMFAVHANAVRVKRT